MREAHLPAVGNVQVRESGHCCQVGQARVSDLPTVGEVQSTKASALCQVLRACICNSMHSLHMQLSVRYMPLQVLQNL